MAIDNGLGRRKMGNEFLLPTIRSCLLGILVLNTFPFFQLASASTVATLDIESLIVTSFEAGNPSSNGFAKGATLTVQFSQATNERFGPSPGTTLSVADVDKLFSFQNQSSSPVSIGKNYAGLWLTPSIFVITILDPGNVTASSLSGAEIKVKPGSGLTDAAGLVTSSSISPPLTGNFGAPAAPIITGFVADGSSAQAGTGFRNQDTLSIKFLQSTNMPGGTGVLDNATVHNLFSFTPDLGNATLRGQWMTPSLFRISVASVDNSHLALIGTTTVNVSSTANLRNANGTSPLSSSVSPALSGSFGSFEVNVTVASGGHAVVMLPSGIIAKVTLPGNASGVIRFTTITASTILNSSSQIDMLGTPLDISTPAGACNALCNLSFEFTTDDLNYANPVISNSTQVKLFQDKGGDGDFKDAGEILPAKNTIVSTGYFVTATNIDQPSTFAVGAVISTGGGTGPSTTQTTIPAGSSSSKTLIQENYGTGGGTEHVPQILNSNETTPKIRILRISYDPAEKMATIVTTKLLPNATVTIISDQEGIIPAHPAEKQPVSNESAYEAPLAPSERTVLVQVVSIIGGKVYMASQDFTLPQSIPEFPNALTMIILPVSALALIALSRRRREIR